MLDTKNGSIDLDELVNSILKDKEGNAATSAASADVMQLIATIEPEQPAIEPEQPTIEPEQPAIEPEQPAIEPEQPAIEPIDEIAVEAEQAFDVTQEPVAESKEAAVVEEASHDSSSESPVKKPRKGLFGWLRHRDQDTAMLEEEWADWGLKPIGHYHDESTATENGIVLEPGLSVENDVLQAANEQSAAVQETPVAEEKQTPSKAVDAATVVIPSVAPPVASTPIHAVVPLAEVPCDDSTQTRLPNQVSLEELVRVEDIEDDVENAEQDDEDPETKLQRAREKKVMEFVLGGEEEEENEPEEEVIPEEDEAEEEIEDFTGYDTTDAVRLEMQYQRRTGLIGLILTVGLELLLLVLTLVTLSLDFSPITDIGYLTVHTFALILISVLNYPSIARGLSGLFSLRANNDSAPALAMAVSLCGVIVHFLNMDVERLPMFAPLAGLLMTFNAIGRQIKLARIWDNFSFVSYQGDKYSAALVEDGKMVSELSRHAMADDMTNVAYFRRASFLSSYLNNATEENDGDRFVRFGMPIAAGLSLMLSLVLLATGVLANFWVWVSGFVFMLCLSSFTLTVAMQLPMRQVCRNMLSRGGFLVGWNAVDAFGRPDALVVDVADLYADEYMLLHGIKTFSGVHIDAAILDAASLSIRAGGPLSLIFRRIIENREDILREVDSLTYEQGMGLSGWVDGRRVLVGNRRLLQNHDIDVPSLDYEARYAKNGRRLVYLSTSGVLSAMFVVSYMPDETIAQALRGLCRSRVTLLVRSNDANITAESLCTDFNLDEYYVDVLPATVGRLYDKLIADNETETPALMASNGHILGTSLVLAACRVLRIKSYFALAARILTALIGLVLCALWSVSDIGSYVLPACGFMLLSGLLGWLLPKLKR